MRTDFYLVRKFFIVLEKGRFSSCLQPDNCNFPDLVQASPTPLPYSVSWQVRSLFQREFSTWWDLVLPFSVSSFLFFLKVLQLLLTSSSSSSHHAFTFITCFWRQFLRKMWPIQLASILFICCKIFLFSLTLCNISSFLTPSVQLVYSKLL